VLPQAAMASFVNQTVRDLSLSRLAIWWVYDRTVP
jgi:hypothetical protein